MSKLTNCKLYNKQNGQSMVELAIWGTLFMGVIFSVPMLAKLADIRHKHHEVVRYSVWERTVWSPGQKSDARIAAEAEQRFITHPASALTAESQTSNPFWQHRGRTILAGDGNDEASTRVQFRYNEAPGENPVVSAIAYGDGLLGSIGNLRLNGNGLANVTVQTRILDRFDETQDHQYVRDTTDEYNMQSTASILTDSWAIGQENELVNRVDGVVIDRVASIAALPGQFAANVSLPLGPLNLREATRAADVDIAAYSEALDDQYIKDKPDN